MWNSRQYREIVSAAKVQGERIKTVDDQGESVNAVVDHEENVKSDSVVESDQRLEEQQEVL